MSELTLVVFSCVYRIATSDFLALLNPLTGTETLSDPLCQYSVVSLSFDSVREVTLV